MPESDENKGKDQATSDLSSENIFRIADELVSQVDKTKKMIIIMIISVVVAIPLTWHIAPLFTSTPDRFKFIGYVTIAIAIAFLALGIRQWWILSKWTGRYKIYKELQRRVDAKLDFENENGNGSK